MSSLIMEQSEVEKSCHGTDDAGLTRNRSFKSKQLVRSQAIREDTSPPRVSSPYTASPIQDECATPPDDSDAASDANVITNNNNSDRTENVSDTSSHSDKCSVINSDRKCDDRKCDDRKKVEIQITSGAWEDGHSEQRLRTRRWLGHRHHSDSSRDLLSYNPRVTCVCGCCACPQCRGRRRRGAACPTKQDSGIVCSDDCPDCSDTEHSGHNGSIKKTGSLDVEERVFYCRCPERKEKPKSFSLTRTDSDDKMEPTGQELVNFIKETLNKNPRDRISLLKIEKELHSLINDAGRCIVRFPVMTSYGRMLVHRCASLFQLAHHLDQHNKNAVLVSKSGTSGGRLPCTSFRQWCTTTFTSSPSRRHEDTNAKSILKREGTGTNGNGSGAAPRSKSLEQRERDYERVRRRIFSSDNSIQDETQWPWLNNGPVKVLTPEAGRNKLLKVQSLESQGVPEAGGRGPVSKSNSFGGYTAEPPAHRILSRQGDLASSSWRLSPSSSGYKTLSLRSTDSVTPSPTGGASPELNSESGALVWAVTDLSAVPVGAVVIHPQTGRPLTNPDGSVYHFDPANPPILYDASAYVQADPKVETNGDKRRGKLEKQHSFMANECECQGEDYRGKSCCECPRKEVCQQGCNEKAAVMTTTNELKTSPNSISPIQPRYTEPPPTDTNQTNVKPAETNQRYDNTKQNHEVANRQAYVPKPKYESPHRNETQRQYDVPNSNKSPKSLESSNQRPQLEAVNQRSFETTNQRPPFENQRSFDCSRQYDRPNVVQECQDAQCYARNEGSQIVSPQVIQTYQPEDVQGLMVHSKTTPVPMADPNIRPMSLTNMGYPIVQQPAYPYMNPYRVDPQQLQPHMYQHIQPEEQKMAQENTFRIDPSYPYAADYSAAYGAYADPAMQQPRGYNVQYGQVEVPQVLPPYQIPNMLMQPPPIQYPQYQEPIQWQSLQPQLPIASATTPKLVLHDMYAAHQMLYPNVYQPYNVLYPQVIPQSYPICQPVYPMIEKHAEVQRRPPGYNTKRNSLPNSARTTPQTPADDKRHDERKRDGYRQNASNESAAKVQHVQEDAPNAYAKENKSVRRDEWRRRNSGSGLLGSCPANAVNGRHMGYVPEESPELMNTRARAILHTLRTGQWKNNGAQQQQQQQARRGNERGDQYERRVRPERAGAPPPVGHAAGQVQPVDRRDARRNYNQMQIQYRPPYLLRQMSPNTWCRRSPAPVAPVVNHPRRPHPEPRNGRR